MSWPRSILSIADFSPADVTHLLDLARTVKASPGAYQQHMRNRYLALLFFEPSTRTYTSFRNAMTRLGGGVSMEFREPKGTSLEKRESVASTLAMAKEYGSDGIVIRHPRDGAAAYAAEVTDLPVINGGDGYNEHPTQNLLDLFTIHERFGRLDHLIFLFFNDLKFGRATRILAHLSLYPGNRFFFLSHPAVGLPEQFKSLLDARSCTWEESFDPADFPRFLAASHVAYGSRTQEERFPQTAEGRETLKHVRGSVVLRASLLPAKKDLVVMHPLPMDKDFPCIARDVDSLPVAYWNHQAGNGIPVRQAMLLLTLGGAHGQ
ncbi:MAG: aspartate carbamoyltransferase [Candidatus Aenigmarchaeota archaeon]|nr:aspartate carbamoyltransferase [Candidatus Aenigmarchaeota archaeon]